MGGGAHAEHRPARLQVIVDELHLLVRKIAEAGGDDHQVGGPERFQAGDVVMKIGIDQTGLRIDRLHVAPPAIEEVTPEMAAPYFAAIGADELVFDKTK